MKNSCFSHYLILLASMVVLICHTPQLKAEEYLLVPIHETVDGGLAAFVERSVETAAAGDFNGIMFHIDTPGGRIDSAVQIKDTILDASVPTIAFIDKNAISAGSLIALSCDHIYMATGGSIGAATAVDLEGQKASEKVISYFRAQMRATAEANGRRADIAEAMVDETLVIDGVTTEGMLVTLTYSEAFSLGISDGTVDSPEDVLALMGITNGTLVDFKMNWAEQVVRLLTHPIVSSLLMSLGFLGLLIEIRTPGWGVGGTIALIALGLFFGSHYIVQLAGIEELVMFITGIVLLGLEILVIPGFGIAGIGGIALIMASFFMSLVGSMPTRQALINATYTVGWALILTAVLGYLVIRLFPKTPLFGRLTLAESEQADAGYRAGDNYTNLLGLTGSALNNLHPVGKADIDGRRVDVISEGGFIAQGAPVVVVGVEGSKIIVREATV